MFLLRRVGRRMYVKVKTMPFFLKIFFLLLTVGWIWSIGEVQKENQRNARLTQQIIRRHQQTLEPRAKK